MADVVDFTLPAADSYYNASRMQVDTGFFQTENTFQFLLAADNRDLFVIKKAGTDSKFTEVHILAADSDYQRYSLQVGTALGETDHTWTFGLAANRDLFAIKRSNTTSRSTEVHVLTKLSNYQSFSVRSWATALHETDQTWQFLVGVNGDLYAIKKQRTGSNSTEIHLLAESDKYQTFSLQTGSGMKETDSKWDFFGLDSSNNIYSIYRTNVGPELYILKSASQYKTFVKMPLQIPNADYRYAFVLAQTSRDVLALKKSHTSSGFMEVTVLSATQNHTGLEGLKRYQASTRPPIRSGLAITDGLWDSSWAVQNTFQFLLAADNRDLFAIKKASTDSKSTEVHILAADSNYQRHFLQKGTPLGETDHTWTFCLAANRDLFAIKRSNTASRSTEVHVLTKLSNYQSFSVRSWATALHETDQTWQFLVGVTGDLYAIKKRRTGSNSTEIHRLAESDKYQSFSLQTGSGIMETHSKWDFFGLDSSNNIYSIDRTHADPELYILHSASQYKTFVKMPLQLPSTDYIYAFVLAQTSHDVLALKKSHTSSGFMEVTVLSAIQNHTGLEGLKRYQASTMPPIRSGLAIPDGLCDSSNAVQNTFEFLLADDNRDLFAIKKAGTGSKSTEVHILAADSNYKRYSLHKGTPLGETDRTWTFGLAANRDLFAIKRSNTTSRSTELSVLTKLSNYQSFSGRSWATCLHETDQTWQFLVGVNGDLYAIKKQRTGSNSTEIHRLALSDKYQSFSLQTGSGIMETDSKWDFFGLDSRNNIYAIDRTNAAPELYILDSACQYKTFVKMPLQFPNTDDHRYAFVLAQTSGDVLALKMSHTWSGFMEVTVLPATQSQTRLEGSKGYQASTMHPIRSGLAITNAGFPGDHSRGIIALGIPVLTPYFNESAMKNLSLD